MAYEAGIDLPAENRDRSDQSREATSAVLPFDLFEATEKTFQNLCR
jgi:hypothetical protein